MRFGKLLTEYKNRCHLTSTDLAKELGVTLTYVRSIETLNKKPPAYERCMQLIKILSLDKKDSELFLRTAFEERLTKDDKTFYEIIKKFNNKG